MEYSKRTLDFIAKLESFDVNADEGFDRDAMHNSRSGRFQRIRDVDDPNNPVNRLKNTSMSSFNIANKDKMVDKEALSKIGVEYDPFDGKPINYYLYKKGDVIDIKNKDFIDELAKVDWIVLLTAQYYNALVWNLAPQYRQLAERPHVRIGNKTFLDVASFMELVDAQEKSNNVKLKMAFDRATKYRNDSGIEIQVKNPKNLR